MCEIAEKETENYLKLDPDPFDDRHPGRVDPDCALGNILTVLFKKDDFMNQVIYCTCKFCMHLNFEMKISKSRCVFNVDLTILPNVTKFCLCSVFQLVGSYIISSRDKEVNTLACRLLFDVIPGLETSIVFTETVSVSSNKVQVQQSAVQWTFKFRLQPLHFFSQ